MEEKTMKKWITALCCALAAILLLFPLYILLINSLDVSHVLQMKYFLLSPSIDPLLSALFTDALYSTQFLNSFFLTIPVVAGHILFAVTSGFALARRSFKFSFVLTALYVAVLLLPSQVTILPNFILCKSIGILNTPWALILPAVFTPLGTVLMRQTILNIPDGVLESASLETNSPISVLLHIVIPMTRPTIVILAFIVFSECWNMVEKALILITDRAKYPLSVVLANLKDAVPSALFAKSVIFILPVLLIIYALSDELIKSVEREQQ